MDTLPIFLRSGLNRALLIGDGPEAAAKAALLARAQITLTLVSEDPCERLRELIDEFSLRHLNKEFEDDDLDGQDLVVIADTAEETAENITARAHQRRLLVNVVGHPELCSFYFPSMIERTPVVTAVCGAETGAETDAALSDFVRRQVEAALPHNLEALQQLMADWQQRLQQAIPDADQRRSFQRQLLDGPLSELLRNGESLPDAVISDALSARTGDNEVTGTVYLIGAGPGDPELLTVKAMRLLQQADVVVYDRLVSPEIMALCRIDAERIDVGKSMGNHTLPQEEINRLLVRLSQQGKRVVRLKGGDPFIFGRGGEEIEELLDENIRFQVIPGITAASGSSSYCGIPLTHRDHAQSVTFVTGHLKAGELNLEWRSLAQSNQTVVFYMGLTALPTIAEQLQAHGMAADTPVALVHRATTPHQRLLVGQLDNIAERAVTEEFKSPSLIILGSVVSLAEKLRQR